MVFHAAGCNDLIVVWQVTGNDYFYIEGASGSIPTSIAKVFSDIHTFGYELMMY